MLWLFLVTSPAEACSYLISVTALTAPTEGEGIWFERDVPSLDFTVEVDGVEVDGSVTEYVDPTRETAYLLFTPSIPWLEGQPYRLLTSEDGAPVVTEGLVQGVRVLQTPRLERVEVSEEIEEGGGGSCINSGEYRWIEASFTAGEAVVLLWNESELVKVAVVGPGSNVSYLREGASDKAACLTAVVMLADGSEVEGERVCSEAPAVPVAPRGCATGGQAGLGSLSWGLSWGLCWVAALGMWRRISAGTASRSARRRR